MQRLTFAIVAFIAMLAAVIAPNVASATRLPDVAPIATPSLPPWIAEIAPIGQSTGQSQIRVRFNYPIVPLTGTDSSAIRSVLKHFSIYPNPSGTFRIASPRVVVFDENRTLPIGTRFRVTVSAGLTDMRGDRVDHSLAWTFETAPVSVWVHWEGGLTPFTTFTISANTALDFRTLESRVTLTDLTRHAAVPFTLAIESERPLWTLTPPPAPDPRYRSDAGAEGGVYTVKPISPLLTSTFYDVGVQGGVRARVGNLALAQTASQSGKSIDPLVFERVELYDANQPSLAAMFSTGGIRLDFNNQLAGDTLAANVTLAPAPRKDVPLFDKIDPTRLNDAALSPNTTYRVNIGPGVTDVYAQSLGNARSATFSTGDFEPDFTAPSGYRIVPANAAWNLVAAGLNLPAPDISVAARRLAVTDVLSVLPPPPSPGPWSTPGPFGDTFKFLPESTYQHVGIGKRRNQPEYAAIPLARPGESHFGVFAYGAYADAWLYQWQDMTRIARPRITGLADVTDLGLFAQVLRENGIFRVNRLHDGSPVVEATIELYDTALDPPAICSSGTTDSDGLLILDAAAIAACVPAFSLPQLVAVARDGPDWTFTRLDIPDAFRDGFGTDFWPTSEFDRRGLFVEDRGIYRPGETAWLEAFAFYGRDGTAHRDAGTRYSVSLGRPNGSTLSLGDHTTDAFGTFPLSVSLPSQAATGYYTVTATGDNGNTFRANIDVQEFKAAQYSVDVTSVKGHPVAGDTVTMTARGRYSYDAPLARGAVDWHVFSDRGEYWPLSAVWSYSFGREWIAPESPPPPPPMDVRVRGSLDAAGRANYSLVIPRHLPYWILYKADVQVSDGSNVPAAARGGVLVAPSAVLIGLSTAGSVSPLQPIIVHVKAFGIDNSVLIGRAVHLDMQRQSVDDRSHVRYVSVAGADVVTAKEEQTATFAPQPPGEYMVRANFAGAPDADSETDVAVTVNGGAPTPEPTANPLDVQAKVWGGAAGDRQDIILKTSYTDADIFVGIIGKRLLWQRKLRVTHGIAELSFTVTDEMVKGSGIEVVAVRRGGEHNGTTAPAGQTLSAVRWASVGAFPRERKFIAIVRPANPVVAPGGRQTLQLLLRDGDGKPAVGQFTVMVDSDDVLQIAGSYLPDSQSFNTFEDPTALGDNRSDVSLTPPTTPLRGPGCCGEPTPAASQEPTVWNPSKPPMTLGAISAVAGPPTPLSVRSHFRPLAYFNGAVRTDNKGRATVSFTLPDDLTTWRARVIAVPAASELSPTANSIPFAHAEATFVARKPLMANPALPPFARTGDRFDAGVIVTNATGRTGTVRLSGTTYGGLSFLRGNPTATASIANLAAGDTRSRFFDVMIGKPAATRVRFDAQLGAAHDAFVVPFTVTAYTTSESTVETGATSTSARIPFAADPRAVRRTGRIDIELANSLLPEIAIPADQFISDEDVQWLEPVASRLAVAAELQKLSTHYGHPLGPIDVRSAGMLDLARLLALQRNDGGFGSVPDGTVSDPYLSAYAADALDDAQRAGFEVDPAAILRLVEFFNALIDIPTQWRYCRTEGDVTRIRLDSMLALAKLGAPRRDHLPEVFGHRDELDFAGSARLAHLLAETPGWRSQARAVFAEAAPLMSYTGRSVFVNLPNPWFWIDSRTVAQSELLEAAIAGSAGAETEDRIVRGLLAMRRGTNWDDPHATASALTALADYADGQGAPGTFVATASFSGRSLGAVDFTEMAYRSASLRAPFDWLPSVSGDLVLAKVGKGTLHYVATYSYSIAGTPPAVDHGLQVRRVVQLLDESGSPALALDAALGEPMHMRAGRIYVISLSVMAPDADVLENLVVTERLPAGLEPVNGSLASERGTLPRFDTRDYFWHDVTVFKDRIVWYNSSASSGYTVTYIARAVTAGSFAWPGADAHLEFAPEEFGRSTARLVRIDR